MPLLTNAGAWRQRLSMHQAFQELLLSASLRRFPRERRAVSVSSEEPHRVPRTGPGEDGGELPLHGAQILANLSQGAFLTSPRQTRKMLTVALGFASRTKHLFVSTYPGANIWQARSQRWKSGKQGRKGGRGGGELLASSKKRALRGAAYIMGPTGALKHLRYGNTNSAS